ncbi:MAG: hypothetical protein PHS93_08490 [Candidatus Omnitrophica bacterium]|nr:hypothetical protein [Candidatus Neomarinimicrobiota bacterium]MDD5353181.1 hypothetical protein [Candidatus Omnitrophota bacterium]
MGPFNAVLNSESLFNLQSHQRQEFILLTDQVPANAAQTGQAFVSADGDFLCQRITGSFETLVLGAGPAIIDDGVNRLSGQLIDGSGGRALFNQRIPLDIFLSPGRRKSALSTTVLVDPPGNTLFYPTDFQYIFRANNLILFDVFNASDTPQTYEICFHGVRIVL